MREKVIWLLEDKDAHFTANWLIADQILALLCEEVEKVENPLFSSSHKGAIHNASLGFEQCRRTILALLRGDD